MKALLGILLSIITLSSCAFKERKFDILNGRTVSVSKLDKLIAKQIDSLSIVGFSVSVIKDSEIVFRKVYGYKNSKTLEKIDTNTVFEIASLSKPLFALFVLKQVEKGTLDLDNPLYEYLTDKDMAKDDRYKLMTARMVLTHTSGLPNWREDPKGGINLLFVPGTEFGYSGEGYEYLKRVILHNLDVDEKGLDSIFRREISQPLGISPLRFTWADSLYEKKAHGHKDGIPTDNGSQGPEDHFGAAGGVHTTPTGYAQFLMALMDRAKLDNELINNLLAPQRDMPQESEEITRSLGFSIKEMDGQIRYNHSGDNGDFKAYCFFYPEQNYGMVMMSNSDNFFTSGFAQTILLELDEEWPYNF